jgi:UDP-N-acetyl-D-glucosamine/UDP-N-acetyl-D-galactosamine dehydrogenase
MMSSRKTAGPHRASNSHSQLRAGYDRTREVVPADLSHSDLCLAADTRQLRDADSFLTIPTHIDEVNRPDLRGLLAAPFAWR